jgi:hypothetical protein
MTAPSYPCIVVAVLCGLLAFAARAWADGAWVLWARPCNVRSQTCSGEWQRLQVYEAERWCKAIWTVAANYALSPEGRQTADRKGIIWEYQCLPDTVDPRGRSAPAGP